MAFELQIRDGYARALLSVAEQLDRTHQIFEDARDLADYFETHPDKRLRVFIESPQVPDKEKRELMRRVFGGRVSPLVVDLMCLMIDKRRSHYIAPVLRRFTEMLDEKNNIYEGYVATAYEMDAAEKQRMQERLEQYAGSKLRLKFRVEPDLIGGVRFKYHNELRDDTLRDGLNEIRALLDGLRLRLEPLNVAE